MNKEACPTIYGPVTSRRHGRSLGINLGNPIYKICTWGCVYCQCGVGERRAFSAGDGLPSVDEVLTDLTEALIRLQADGQKLDSVTFAGNTESGAHPEFLKIVLEVKKIRKARNESWILNCLSNGSEIDRPETIEAYQHLDEAWIKLDCATEELFQSLNRPITSVGTIQDHLERLKKIPSLCLQTLVWKCSRNPSAANWTPANRKALISAYRKLAPKAIHLTTISREPAAIALEPVNVEELADFAREVRKLGLQIDVFP